MTTIITILLTTIFLILSSIHIYWGSGGKWGSSAVIPTKEDNVKVMMPSAFATFFVAFGLLGFALIVLLNGLELNVNLPYWLSLVQKYGLWVITGIFTLRAIGDFNYIGFFKKYKHTKFAKNDSKYYSPLCLTIGVLSIILELYK